MKKHVIALLVGSLLGTVIAVYVNQMVTIPTGLSAIIILFFVLLSMGIGNALIRDPADPEKLDAAAHNERWAWLLPQTTKLSSGFPLSTESITVGRDVQNRIMLNDESVSRFHGELTRTGESFILRDLGSTNGTFVNGQRIEEQLLSDGDRVAFGDAVFTLRLPKTIKPLAAEPEEEEPARDPGSETFVDF